MSKLEYIDTTEQLMSIVDRLQHRLGSDKEVGSHTVAQFKDADQLFLTTFPRSSPPRMYRATLLHVVRNSDTVYVFYSANSSVANSHDVKAITRSYEEAMADAACLTHTPQRYVLISETGDLRYMGFLMAWFKGTPEVWVHQ